MSLSQAAMLGKPVIATNEGGNPNIIEHRKTGLLVKSRDVNSLAKAMFEIVEKPEKTEQMAKNIRQKYEQELDFEKTIKEKFIPLIEN